jgi:hypothetical protein
MVAASCSKSSSPGSGIDGGGGGTGGAVPTSAAGGAGSGGVGSGGAGAGGTASTGGAGGKSTNADAAAPPMTQMRFLQVFINGGNKGVFDLWTLLPGDVWYSVYRYLNYGQLTDFIQVPNGTGLNTHIWFVPAGKDPSMYYLSMTDEMNFKIPESDTGKHTIFSYFVGSPSDWAHMMVADADPRLTPPAGYAHVDFITYALAGAYPVVDYGISPGACVDRSQQGYYQRLVVGTYQFSLYAGDGTNCQGSLIATTPPTQLADGDVWHLYAMGDATNGFALMPVKLDRN